MRAYRQGAVAVDGFAPFPTAGCQRDQVESRLDRGGQPPTPASADSITHPARQLTDITMASLTAHLAPFETRKPEFGGAIGRA
jgi:hypothetical protein